MMKYKNYAGSVDYDADEKVFRGRVIGTADVITFEGRTANEIEKAFRDSVDDYLTFCEEMGREPEKPFSGKLLLRLTPELHRDVTVAAASENQSINTFIENILSERLSEGKGRSKSSGKQLSAYHTKQAKRSGSLLVREQTKEYAKRTAKGKKRKPPDNP